MLLVGCDYVEDPVKSCVINSKIGAECGLRDFDIRNRSVGDFIGKTKLKPLSECDNCVCVDGKRWASDLKPALKLLNTKRRQRNRR